MKRCTKCGEQKPLDSFYKNTNPRATASHESWCKRCQNIKVAKRRKQNPVLSRASDWRKRGVNPDHALAALRAHTGHCELCGADNPGTKKGWAVDHCHATGKVRGILCVGCNTGLGGFKDNLETLRKAAEYLKRSAA